MRQALQDAGWEPILVDDYADFKNIFARRKAPLGGSFTRLEMIAFMADRARAKLAVHFRFFADPGLRKRGEFTFDERSAWELFAGMRGFCSKCLRRLRLGAEGEAELNICRPTRFSAPGKVDFGRSKHQLPSCILEAGYTFRFPRSRGMAAL